MDPHGRVLSRVVGSAKGERVKETILVTGGAGYIGSHATLALLESGKSVLVLDNLSNGSFEAVRRVAKISARTPQFVQGDIRDAKVLKQLFAEHHVGAVLHFAGLKAVGESVQNPLDYYQNNLVGTVQLCQAMADAKVYRLVFSSSATVYGEPDQMPIREDFPIAIPTNPYGRTKLMAEEFLRDLAHSDPRWGIALLRYFNPVGAHPSGLIGEDPNGLPNNLLPYMSQVAIGKLKALSVFGDDYPTRDGTGVRDYIHVVDLVNGHIKALEVIARQSGLDVWNLGTGLGHSVLEVIHAFERASGRQVPYEIVPRRPGDIAECWADPSKALRELGWKAERDLGEMMADAWRWQSGNAEGYRPHPRPQRLNST